VSLPAWLDADNRLITTGRAQISLGLVDPDLADE
jgi:hypothetical protein